MIEALSLRWAQMLKEAVPEHPTSIAVIKFGLQLLIGTFLTLIIALTFSIFTGKTFETFLVLFTFGILRAVSGGYHFKSALACVISTVIFSNLIAFSSFKPSITLIATVISVLLALAYAPSNIEKQTRIPKKYFPRLKILSIAIISINFLIVSPVIALTFLLQAITLIKIRR